MTVLYMVESWRLTNGHRERVTKLYRQWPAARRYAAAERDRDRGPVRISYAVVPTWTEIEGEQ